MQQPAGPALGTAIRLQSTGLQELDVIDERGDAQRLRAQWRPSMPVRSSKCGVVWTVACVHGSSSRELAA